MRKKAKPESWGRNASAAFYTVFHSKYETKCIYVVLTLRRSESCEVCSSTLRVPVIRSHCNDLQAEDIVLTGVKMGTGANWNGNYG